VNFVKIFAFCKEFTLLKIMNDAREQILRNLRRAAAKPTEIDRSKTLPAWEDAAIYRNYQPAQQEPLKAFAEKLAKLKGEFYQAGDEIAAAKILRELISPIILPSSADHANTPSQDKRAAARHRHALIDRIFAVDNWLTETVQAIDRQNLSSAEFAAFAVGVTAVDFLVARTGSLVLSSATAGGRRLSVLPPFHIAIATTAQLVLSLDEVMKIYQRRGEANRSSYATIITGPSRTSDIEKILVLGAHGPKRLAVIVLG
jgi:L-lactate dehydrogenase complex protein LldG